MSLFNTFIFFSFYNKETGTVEVWDKTVNKTKYNHRFIPQNSESVKKIQEDMNQCLFGDKDPIFSSVRHPGLSESFSPSSG